MFVDRRALAGALAALVLVSACGGSASPTPGASQAPATAQAPAETQAPGGIGVPGSAGGLEALLPSEVNGVTFTKTSLDYGAMAGAIPTGDLSIDDFLSANGKSLKDVKFAMATATSPDAAGSLVYAIQIQGLPADKMLEWAKGGPASGEDAVTIGGKAAFGDASMGILVYVKGDTVFMIVAPSKPGLAEAILAKLP